MTAPDPIAAAVETIASDPLTPLGVQLWLREHHARIAAAMEPLVAEARTAALREAAEVVERLRQWNPINGDGSNYTLDRTLAGLNRLAGDDGPTERAAEVRKEMADERNGAPSRARGDRETP